MDVLGRLICLVKLKDIVVRDVPKHINFSEDRLLKKIDIVRKKSERGKKVNLRCFSCFAEEPTFAWS